MGLKKYIYLHTYTFTYVYTNHELFADEINTFHSKAKSFYGFACQERLALK